MHRCTSPTSAQVLAAWRSFGHELPHAEIIATDISREPLSKWLDGMPRGTMSPIASKFVESDLLNYSAATKVSRRGIQSTPVI